MIYNAIEMREAIDKLIDRVKSPRFTDNRYYEAINQASIIILDDRLESIKSKKDYSFQSSERLRGELASLIPPTLTTIPVGNLVPFPADYYYLLLMENTISGVKNACNSITYNEKGLLQRNPFKRPSQTETYYNERSIGWEIELPATGTFDNSQLAYIKRPNLVSIGFENDKIDSAGLLIDGVSYMAYDETVYNNNTYYEGQIFTAIAPNLNIASGIVIPTSVIVNSDMPEHLQDEVVRLSSAIMEGTVENYNKQKILIDTNNL